MVAKEKNIVHLVKKSQNNKTIQGSREHTFSNCLSPI